MNDRRNRLLGTLALMPANAALDPAWEPLSRRGFVYRLTGSELDDLELFDDLETLAEEGYLERVFIERLSLCPNCESHALNVHESCLTCGSSNLRQFKAIFHFRCGFIGPTEAYKKEDAGLRCPKCNRILRDLGTDHDSPGDYFECLSCGSMLQVPEVGARCLSCGAGFLGSALQSVGRRDVYAYRITAVGGAALRESQLLDRT
jgi:hypothetical protein